MKPLEVVLVGAGGRGIDAFGAFALKHPEYMKFVAVAEPREERRRHFAQQHGIPEERQFASWAELFAQPKMAEACVNATMDQDHLPSAVPALEAGYDLFPRVAAQHSEAIAKRFGDRLDDAELAQLVELCDRLRRTE